MTHCNNCGHSETFVLLAQFALEIPGPDAVDEASTPVEGSANPVERRSDDVDRRRTDSSGEFSLAVQCSACDSTDVGVAAGDLLARYGSSTTS